MILFDPEQREFYRIDMNTFEWRYEINSNIELNKKLHDKAVANLREIKHITNSAEQRKFYWKYHEEADYFRRRKFIQPPEEESEENVNEFIEDSNNLAEIPFVYVLIL